MEVRKEKFEKESFHLNSCSLFAKFIVTSQGKEYQKEWKVKFLAD